MEQIQGTEALEREILEDAAKKAEKIKTKAEGEAARILAETQSLLQKKIAQLLKEHEARIVSLRNELRSRVPTEKSRLQISFMDSELKTVLDELFEQDGAKLLSLWCVKQLEKNQKLIYAGSADILWKGLHEEGQKKLEEFCKKSAFPLVLHYDAGLPARGVRVKPKDQSYECWFTEKELRDWMLDDKRGLLAEALFGDLSGENSQNAEIQDTENRDKNPGATISPRGIIE